MDQLKKTDWRKRLLPGQFSIDEALAEALRKASDAFRDEAYKQDWPEEDRKALNVPEEKGRAIR